jgi:hypothetical protein
MNIWMDVAGRHVNYEIDSAFLQESPKTLTELLNVFLHNLDVVPGGLLPP